ncbi:MAG: hypothetical protein J5507_07120 [Clostridia bacterium]|nr:hypothetical protein [Clostridia bacterium]
MLKSNKGITMTSLVIYVIVLMIVITLLSGFAGYFYKNVKLITIKEASDEQFTRFLAYLTKDINKGNINFVKNGTYNETNYIILKFEDSIEHQYLYKNNTIYFIDKNENKKINLCNNVNSCDFMYDDNSKLLNTNININNKNYTKALIVNNN